MSRTSSRLPDFGAPGRCHDVWRQRDSDPGVGVQDLKIDLCQPLENHWTRKRIERLITAFDCSSDAPLQRPKEHVVAALARGHANLSVRDVCAVEERDSMVPKSVSIQEPLRKDVFGGPRRRRQLDATQEAAVFPQVSMVPRVILPKISRDEVS